MSNLINLPSFGGMHFGRTLDLKIFENCFFEEIHSETNIINKIIITKIDYKPDEIYIKNDGIAGKCWLADVMDSRIENDDPIQTLYFRNFGDVIVYFEKEGFKFVSPTNN